MKGILQKIVVILDGYPCCTQTDSDFGRGNILRNDLFKRCDVDLVLVVLLRRCLRDFQFFSYIAG